MTTSSLLLKNENNRLSRTVRKLLGNRLVQRIAAVGAALLFPITRVWIQRAAIAWGIGAFVRWFFSSALRLYNFNWNQSASQTDAQIQAQMVALAGYWGSVVGQSIGWLVCGALPGVAITRFNPALGAYILKEVGEEAIDEISSALGAAIELSARSRLNSMALRQYQNIRRWFFSSDNTIAQIALGDKYGEARQAYLEDRQKAWTIAGAVENFIEGNFGPATANFLEEAVEEAIDACMEAGFVIAGAADEWIAEQRMSKNLIMGPQHVLEIQPDRTNEEEKIILAGPETLLKAQVLTAIATHQMVEGRDVGQLVGVPVAEYVRSDPLTLRLNIELYSKRTPPYGYGRSADVVRASFSIPNVSRTKVDWERIKQVCGGNNGYMWGRFWACANLKSGRKIKIYAATADEAHDRVLAALQLTEDEVNTINFGEEPREGARRTNPRLYKESTRVYPAYCTVLNRELQQRIDVGRPTTGGNYIDRKYRFDLWLDRKPDEFEESLRDLFRYSGGEE